MNEFVVQWYIALPIKYRGSGLKFELTRGMGFVALKRVYLDFEVLRFVEPLAGTMVM